MQVSAAALVIAIGLVPGYLFLWLTAGIRKPGTGSTVSELLEVLLVGVATTGITAAGMLLIWPGLLRDNTDTFQHIADADNAQIRCAVGAIGALLVIALGLAFGLAQFVKEWVRRRKSRYVPNVFDGTFNTKPTDHFPQVTISMIDGSSIAGPLLSFSDTDAEDERMVSLQKPITRWGPKSTEWKPLPHDQFIAMGSQIKFISVRHRPIVSDAPPERPSPTTEGTERPDPDQGTGTAPGSV